MGLLPKMVGTAIAAKQAHSIGSNWLEQAVISMRRNPGTGFPCPHEIKPFRRRSPPSRVSLNSATRNPAAAPTPRESNESRARPVLPSEASFRVVVAEFNLVGPFSY